MTGGGEADGPGGREAGASRLALLVREALAEDVGPGDWTTEWTVPRGREGRARIVAREEGLVAGREAAQEVLRQAGGGDLAADWESGDGASVRAGEVVARVQGPLDRMLVAERTLLNFLGRLSGVATRTARFVRAVEGTGARITDTRKTTPGWRALEKAATRAGGAENHRLGLYDMVLIKENHVRAAGGIAAALRAAVPRAREAGIPVEVEVTDLDELDEALGDAPDRILLDNMDVRTLERAVERVRLEDPEAPLLEASGGVTLRTVRAVAETGVDLVSVGSITHSAPALDLSMLVEEA